MIKQEKNSDITQILWLNFNVIVLKLFLTFVSIFISYNECIMSINDQTIEIKTCTYLKLPLAFFSNTESMLPLKDM